MNLFTLINNQLHSQQLIDGTWQKADFFDLSTASLFWNRAIIITLSKELVQTPETALIYLVQKQTKALGIWDKVWGETMPTVSELIHYFISEKGFTNTQGKPITIESFWEKYCASIEGSNYCTKF